MTLSKHPQAIKGKVFYNVNLERISYNSQFMIECIHIRQLY